MLKYSLPLLLLIIFTTGCAPNENYRNDLSLCQYKNPGDCTGSAIQQSANASDEEYQLGFVEFDDQGQLRNRQQLTAVLDHFYPIASQQEVLLVSFVHGWHHSAMPDDTNIIEFRNLLSRLARAEAISSRDNGYTPRKVLGVYVGWRGDSINLPWVNELTFWDRKNTAHNVGSGGVAEVFLKLEEIVNVKSAISSSAVSSSANSLPPENPASSHKNNSRLVVIGHSFGGAIVSTAMHQILTDRFIDSRRDKSFQGDANGFGDLVVLINPAFEAIKFSSLYDISQQNCRRYFNTQLPKLAILTSESDWATKYAFPAGRFFSTLFETHSTLERHYCDENGKQTMQLDEGEAGRKSVGHFETYQTHKLVPSKKILKRTANFKYQSLHKTWLKLKPAQTMHFESVELQHLDRTRPKNPYLNIYVDKPLIADHNDIWGDDVVSFIRDMIVISTSKTSVN